MDPHDLQGKTIVHVQKTLGVGGSELHIGLLCRGLADLGARCHIAWLRPPSVDLQGLRRRVESAGVEQHEIVLRHWADPTALHALWKLLAALEPAIVHLHLIHATLLGTLVAKALGRSRIVVTRHRDEPYQKLPWFRVAARTLDRAAHRIIAPSQWVASYTARWDGTPQDKLLVIPHGIEPIPCSPLQRRELRRNLLESWNLPGGDFLFVSVARLHPSKDHATLLAAFEELAQRYQRVWLVVVGDGPLRNKLVTTRDRMAPEISRRLLFIGEVSRPMDLLCAADGFVHATLREGFGLAVLEALSAGLPVVASRVGPMSELIEDGRSGLLVPPRSATALRKAMEQLIRDDDLRRLLASGARKRANLFSAERMVQATAQAYADLLAST